MNKISFKGSNTIIGDLVSRFFSLEGETVSSPEAAHEQYVKVLRKKAEARSIDPLSLEMLFDYLIAHGVAKERLDRLTGECIDELVQLARDVETLRRYRRDGTITDVRVVDEWPF